MVELLVSKTGLPKKIVQHVLDEQVEIIKACLINQEEIHFPRVLKLRSEKQKFSWRGTVGSGDGERIVLRARPVRAFRQELNKWTSSEL
jgi:nucleoid DNA-binding protein